MNTPHENKDDQARPPDKGKGKAFAFPKSSRLVRKGEFDAVFQEGWKAVTEGLVMYVRTNGLDRNRLGLVVSKKCGKAVCRNRIRRLLREAFRLENPTLPQGYDLVCIPRMSGFPSGAAGVILLLRDTLMKALRRSGNRSGDRSGNRSGDRAERGNRIRGSGGGTGQSREQAEGPRRRKDPSK